MKKFGATVVAIFLLVGLSACAVSGEEAAACKASGGQVVSEKFPYENPGFWGRRDTTSINYCKNSDGSVGKVYEKEVRSTEGASDKHKAATTCENKGGKFYDAKSTRRVGKTTRVLHDYFCVSDGKITPVKL